MWTSRLRPENNSFCIFFRECPTPPPGNARISASSTWCPGSSWPAGELRGKRGLLTHPWYTAMLLHTLHTLCLLIQPRYDTMLSYTLTICSSVTMKHSLILGPILRAGQILQLQPSPPLLIPTAQECYLTAPFPYGHLRYPSALTYLEPNRQSRSDKF